MNEVEGLSDILTGDLLDNDLVNTIMNERRIKNEADMTDITRRNYSIIIIQLKSLKSKSLKVI